MSLGNAFPIRSLNRSNKIRRTSNGTSMIKTIIRLICLRAAAQHSFATQPENVVSLANDYYQWVIGKTDRIANDAAAKAIKAAEFSTTSRQMP